MTTREQHHLLYQLSLCAAAKKGGSACNLLPQPAWCSGSGWGFKWPMMHGFRSVPGEVLLFLNFFLYIFPYTNRKDKLRSVFCFVLFLFFTMQYHFGHQTLRQINMKCKMWRDHNFYRWGCGAVR